MTGRRAVQPIGPVRPAGRVRLRFLHVGGIDRHRVSPLPAHHLQRPQAGEHPTDERRAYQTGELFWQGGKQSDFMKNVNNYLNTNMSFTLT